MMELSVALRNSVNAPKIYVGMSYLWVCITIGVQLSNISKRFIFKKNNEQCEIVSNA